MPNKGSVTYVLHLNRRSSVAYEVVLLCQVMMSCIVH
jgi:hypothetical protein